MQEKNSKSVRNSQIFVRIDRLREKLLFNQATFADKTGISRAFYSDLKTGRVGISGEILYGIAKEFPWVNMNWVLTGEGEMFTDELYESIVKEGIAEYQTRNKELAELVREINELPKRKQTAIIHYIKGQLALIK